MTKYISLAIVLGMMLTLVGVIPAEAKAYTDYPYIYSDFEDASSLSELKPSKSDIAWSEGGAGGSKGALHITQQSAGTGAMSDHFFSVLDAHFMVNNKFKMSAWVKLDTTKTKLKQTIFGFAFWGPAVDKDGNANANRWMTQWTVSDEKFNSGEWVYVEKIIESWNGAMNSGWTLDPDAEGEFKFGVRLGDVSANVFGNAVADDSPTQELSWYIDDFIIEPVLDEYAPEADEPEDEYLANMDFSSSNLSAYGVTNGSNLTYKTENGADGQPGFISRDTPKNTLADVGLKALPFKYNKLYKFSFQAKADDADSEGSRISVCMLRADRLDRTNDTAYGNYHYLYTPNDLTTEWKYYEIYMALNIKSFDESPVAVLFRGGNSDRAKAAGVQEGAEGVSFSMDDIKIEEISVPANGDFEWPKDDVPTTSSNLGGNDDSKKYGTFYSWFQSDATVEESDDVPTGSAGVRSAKITTTAAGGGVSQGVFIENNVESEITFWAKGEGDSVGKNIQVKLDRAVANKSDNDVYTVPDTELLGDNLVLEANWKQYTIPYNSAFPTPAGANANAGPRQPFMSFVVDDGAAGLTYYVDDVSIAVNEASKPAYDFPYATNLTLDSSNIVGGTAMFSYEYQTEIDAFEGDSVVRVIKELADGTSVTLAQLSALTNIYEYVIPEEAIGGTLRFELMPFTEADANNSAVAGAVYKITASEMVEAAYTITPALGEFSAESDSITGTLFVENNKADDSDMNMFLAIILYDEEEGIVRFDSKPISVTKGNSNTITLSVTTADDPALKPIAKARAFVWGGTGIFDTDMISYADMLEVTK